MKNLSSLLTMTFMLSLTLAYGQTTPKQHFQKTLSNKSGLLWGSTADGYAYNLWLNWRKDIKSDTVAQVSCIYRDARIGINKDSFEHYKRSIEPGLYKPYTPIELDYRLVKAFKNIYVSNYSSYEEQGVISDNYTSNLSVYNKPIIDDYEERYIHEINFNDFSYVVNYIGVEHSRDSNLLSLPPSITRQLTNIREARYIAELGNKLPVELWSSRKKIQVVRAESWLSNPTGRQFRTMHLPNLRMYEMLLYNDNTTLPDFVFKANKLQYLVFTGDYHYPIKETTLVNILSSPKFSELTKLKVLSLQRFEDKLLNSPKLIEVLETNTNLHHIYCIEAVDCHLSAKFVRALKPYKGLIIDPDWSDPDMVEAIKSLKNLEYLCIKNCPDSLSVLEDIVSALPNLKTFIYEWCNHPIEYPEYSKGHKLAQLLQEKYPSMKIKTCLDVADLP